MLKKVNAAAERIFKIFDWAACFMLIFAIIAMLLQILFRLTQTNNQWTQIAATYSYAALVFLGCTSASLHAEHIAITTIIDLLPNPIRRIVDLAIQLLIAVMSGILTYSSWNLVQASRILTSPAMPWFKMNYLYAPIGLSCLFMTLAALLRFINLLADKDLLEKERQEKAAEEMANEEKILEEYDKLKEDM